MRILIYLGVRGGVGSFSLNYSMGTLMEDPDTPDRISYNFLPLHQEDVGSEVADVSRKEGKESR